MRIAIYSRKSKWTGKGDSIENQLVMCREYIISNFPNIKEEEIYEYEDEGFSGKNTQRPRFIQMMSDLRREHYDYLVCYKLDRLGRNLTDLVNLIEELSNLDTSFISIKERFDTSTPIGRAMMFFTGVLAQMEREQIAERVRDNMLMLARSGRWLGGTTPLGFSSKREEVIAWNNKIKTSHRLAVNENEIGTVKFIYHEFLEKQSLSQLVTYFLQNKIKTRNGKEYQISTIRDILTNPVYCTADQEAYEYFDRLGCHVCIEEHELDGVRGLISYGKTSSSKYKNKQNDVSGWIISISKHKGIIKGKDWVKVQQLIRVNKKKGDSFRKVQNTVSLLSGILHCRCGYTMRAKYYPPERLDENGDRTFAYLCSHKEKSNRKNCNISNVHGNTMDRLVWETLLVYIKPDNKVRDGIEKLIDNLDTKHNNHNTQIGLLEHELKEKKSRISQLLLILSKSEDDETFIQYVKQQIGQIHNESSEIERKIKNITESHQRQGDNKDQYELVKERLSSYANVMKTLSVLEKREYLHKVLHKVVWDGENAHIYFHDSTIALPHPLGPTIAKNSPSFTSKETSNNACVSPSRL